MKKVLKIVTCLIVMLFISFQSAQCQWPTTPDQRLMLGYGTEVKNVSDGIGGEFVVFTAVTGVMQSSCYMQKTNEYGVPLFSFPLLLDSGNGVYVDDFQAVSDEEGGIIIGVLERCGVEPNWFWKISMYRFNSDAEIIYWNLSANLCGEVVPQDYFVMTTDNLGGCYLAYMSTDFRVQRLDSQGNQLWGDEGISMNVGSAYPLPYDLTVGADDNYCYLTIRGTDLYAFKFSVTGQPLWGEDGIIINDLGEETQLAPDGTGGFVEICRDPIQNHLIVYRLDDEGNWVWSQEGVALGAVYWDKSVLCNYPYVYVNWLSNSSPYLTKLQKLDYSGNLQWTESINVFSETENQDDPCMSNTDEIGLIFLTKQSNGLTFDLYAQKVSYEGEKLWEPNGVLLNNRGYSMASLDVCSDGSGGSLCSWYEIDPFYGQTICAAMVNREGGLGEVLGINPWQTPSLPKTIAMSVYPNPANPSFVVAYNLIMASSVKLQIVNCLGQVILTDEFFKKPGNYKWQPSFKQNLPSGNYYIILETNQERINEQVCVIK